MSEADYLILQNDGILDIPDISGSELVELVTDALGPAKPVRISIKRTLERIMDASRGRKFRVLTATPPEGLFVRTEFAEPIMHTRGMTGNLPAFVMWVATRKPTGVYVALLEREGWAAELSFGQHLCYANAEVDGMTHELGIGCPDCFAYALWGKPGAVYVGFKQV